MPTIVHTDGFILGGVCHKRLNDRMYREQGARRAWSDLQKQKCMEKLKDKLTVVKEIIKPKYFKHGNIEIGYMRACQEIFAQLFETGRLFTLKLMDKWLSDVARFEFGIRAKHIVGNIFLGPSSFSLIESNTKDDILYYKGHGKTYIKEKIKQLRRIHK